MKETNYRADNTYLIEGNTGDNPKLMGRALSDGRDSLYLEYYFGKVQAVSRTGREYSRNERKTEPLGLYIWRAPRTSAERKQNKETLDIARRLRFEKSQEVLEMAEGYRLRNSRDINFLDWMKMYADRYTKADIREIRRACRCFGDFLASSPVYGRYAVKLRPAQISKDMIRAFTEYLTDRFVGEGPSTVYRRFKKIIKNAVENDVILKNPTTGITIRVDYNTLRKDILNMDEIKMLIATHCRGENPDVRRAFIFCLYCGLRWCDVKDLTYGNVDYSNRLLRFEQSKTKGHSASSGVVIPLNDALLKLIGDGDRQALIFPLPSHTMCLKALRHWTEKAGIMKHITWHCARHSFAVNILNNGANIKTVASLLGHSSIRETEKYTRVIDSLKEAAINSLPVPDLE